MSDLKCQSHLLHPFTLTHRGKSYQVPKKKDIIIKSLWIGLITIGLGIAPALYILSFVAKKKQLKDLDQVKQVFKKILNKSCEKQYPKGPFLKESPLKKIELKREERPKEVQVKNITPPEKIEILISEGDSEEDLMLFEDEPSESFFLTKEFEEKILATDNFSELNDLTHGKKFFALFPHTVVIKRGEKGQDRFSKPVPYSHTIVELPEDENLENTYINASWISFPESQKKYIAMQAPLEKTAASTWHMIFHHHVKHMVMLSTEHAHEDVEKSKRGYQYWPKEVGSSMIFPPYKITLLEEKPIELDDANSLIIRKLSIEYKDRKEKVFHYQIPSWADFGTIPPVALKKALLWINKKRKKQGDENTPLLCHCTAGCGRTGTLIGTDYLLENPTLDPRIVVALMRFQRMMMVQTEEQNNLIKETIKL